MPKHQAHTPSAAVPLESQVYTASYRAVAGASGIKVYNGAGKVDVARAMSFDTMDAQFSSVDLVAASLLSEVLLVCEKEFASHGEELMDLEGRARIDLSDPLVLAGVRGMQGEPRIAHASIDVYLFTFMEEEQARGVIDNALKRAVVYQTLQVAFPIDVRFSFAQ